MNRLPTGPSLAQLNFQHLRYFWTAAREGSVTRAAKELNLTQPAVSSQIKALETALGEQLFVKAGRHLALTDVGHVVYEYASEIFALGRELTEHLRGRPGSGTLRLVVGVSEAIPKLLAYRLLDPAFHLDRSMRVVLRNDKVEPLLAELAIHAVDVVLADTPIPPGVQVRGYSHLLGESGVTFCAAGKGVAALARGFPASLDGAKMLLPTDNTALRRSLNDWFARAGIRPALVAEIEDSAVLKVFGQQGAGVFPVATAVEAEVCRQYKVRVVGRAPEVRERFYAISAERRITHPAVAAISAGARDVLGSKR